MSAVPSLCVRTLRSLLGVLGNTPSGRPPTVRGFMRNPLAAAGIGVPSAAFLSTQIGAPVGSAVSDLIDPKIEERAEALRMGLDQYQESVLDRLSKARQREEIERNMMMVQRSDPHLYNQVMAGRRLPQGSVVLGGAPRQDLMEELASYMGSLPDPDPVFQ